MTINPNDPAFAIADEEGLGGLTKREYAAIKALQGLLADSEVTTEPPDLAKAAIRYADALFAELAKSEQKPEVVGF